MADSPNKHKHLDYIQAVIGRMSSNLFLLKGWGVTLIAALLALAAKETDGTHLTIAYFPLVIFWLLDGYYLSQERRYRALYDYVREIEESKVDFSMSTLQFANARGGSWVAALTSKTIVIYYGGLAVIVTTLAMLVK